MFCCGVDDARVIQVPNSGFMGLFKKNAIIVATKKKQDSFATQNSDIQKEKAPYKTAAQPPREKQEIKKEYRNESKPKEEFKTRAYFRK